MKYNAKEVKNFITKVVRNTTFAPVYNTPKIHETKPGLNSTLIPRNPFCTD